MSATERNVAFTGSSKLYGGSAPPGGVPGGKGTSSAPVKFRVLVHENARQRRTPGVASPGKYEYLVPSSSKKRVGTSTVTPVGLGHDFSRVIAASPVGGGDSPEEKRRLLRLQVLQHQSDQAANALGAIESSHRASARREREEIQETGTLSNLVRAVAVRHLGAPAPRRPHPPCTAPQVVQRTQSSGTSNAIFWRSPKYCTGGGKRAGRRFI